MPNIPQMQLNETKIQPIQLDIIQSSPRTYSTFKRVILHICLMFG